MPRYPYDFSRARPLTHSRWYSGKQVLRLLRIGRMLIRFAKTLPWEALTPSEKARLQDLMRTLSVVCERSIRELSASNSK